MSIYSTTVRFDADDHDPSCARWVECSCDDGHSSVMIHAGGGHSRYDDTIACTCRCGPIAYQRSHVLPSDEDRRDGLFSLAEIPGHITAEGREEREEHTPWPWLRVSMLDRDFGDVVLDRSQVVEVHAYLGDWLTRTEAT